MSIEAVDYPRPGDRVAYMRGDGTGTVLGRVVSVAAHDGDADIALPPDYDPAACARDVKIGDGPHTYRPLDTHRGETPVSDPEIETDDPHATPAMAAICPECGQHRAHIDPEAHMCLLCLNGPVPGATPEPTDDPRVESALSLLLYEIGQRGGQFGDPRDLVRVVLEGADEASGTVPVDREALRDARAILQDWRNGSDAAFIASRDVLARLPDPDADR